MYAFYPDKITAQLFEPWCNLLRVVRILSDICLLWLIWYANFINMIISPRFALIHLT